ncbi:hypothetical protein ACQHIH_21970 (plasmid) [Xanthomonas sontii]|uniref:hypothetical protein n=1 Tax=Xanthomonas sontii TaxID=2650745 RepID=UPI003F86D6F3
MEEMTSRVRKKITQPVGNHPAKWMTDTERFRVVSVQAYELRDLRHRLGADPDRARDVWMAKEAELAGICGKLTAILRDRVPPVVFRQIDDMVECMERPEDLSPDCRCWAHLGTLDAVSATYGAMVTARLGHSDFDQAALHLLSTFAGYRANAYRLYAEVHAQCQALCWDAEPQSLHVSIADVEGYPVLEVTFNLRRGTESA